MQDRAEPRTIPELVRFSAQNYASREAVVDGQVRLTFDGLQEQVALAARGLMSLGVERGDRVALWAPNTFRWVIGSLAAASVGAAVVPLNTRYRGIEAHEILRRARATVLMAAESFLKTDYLELLADAAAELGYSGPAPLIPGLPALRTVVLLPSAEGLPDRTRTGLLTWTELLARADNVSATDFQERAGSVEPDDVADIVFTSGTTGRSKGVLSAHRQTLGVATSWAGNAQVRSDDRYLIISPFSHTFGYKVGILVCLGSGATIYPMATFDLDETLRLLREEGITVLPGAPTIHQSILDHPDRPDAAELSWRVAVLGSAMVPERLLHRLRGELKVDHVITAYGLSEAVVVTMCRPGDSVETVSSTAGLPTAACDVKIADTDGQELPANVAGEVLVRGPNVMLGYLDDPAATSAAIDADGWLHTGDIGILNEDGYLSIVDRIKDMFTVGGFNVYPAEVENTISGIEGVVACAVVGVPDDRMGEVAKAYVETLPEAGLTAEQVVAHCRRWLANYKVPRSVEITGRLPRNAMGKILKRELQTISAPTEEAHA
ncbi:MAG: AMP-binding protein [Actinomycetota bacterium]